MIGEASCGHLHTDAAAVLSPDAARAARSLQILIKNQIKSGRNLIFFQIENLVKLINITPNPDNYSISNHSTTNLKTIDSERTPRFYSPK